VLAAEPIGADEADGRVALDDADHLLEAVRVQEIVRAEDLAVVRLGRQLTDRPVPALEEVHVLVVGDDADPLVSPGVVLGDLACAVRASVVADDVTP
jgi:hypothetical protein